MTACTPGSALGQHSVSSMRTPLLFTFYISRKIVFQKKWRKKPWVNWLYHMENGCWNSVWLVTVVMQMAACYCRETNWCISTVHGRWYFVVTALSGTFAVTFSIVFAYVADITSKEDRSAAYGLVSIGILLQATSSLCILYLGGALIRPYVKWDISTAVGQFWLQTCSLFIEQVAQLSQRDRRMPYVSWNLVSCCTTVRKITFD